MAWDGVEKRKSDALLVEVAQHTATIPFIMKKIDKLCSTAESDNGFARCQFKELRIQTIETRWDKLYRYRWYFATLGISLVAAEIVRAWTA